MSAGRPGVCPECGHDVLVCNSNRAGLRALLDDARARVAQLEEALNKANKRVDDLCADTRDPIDQNYIAIRRDAWEMLHATFDRFDQDGLLTDDPAALSSPETPE